MAARILPRLNRVTQTSLGVRKVGSRARSRMDTDFFEFRLRGSLPPSAALCTGRRGGGCRRHPVGRRVEPHCLLGRQAGQSGIHDRRFPSRADEYLNKLSALRAFFDASEDNVTRGEFNAFVQAPHPSSPVAGTFVGVRRPAFWSGVSPGRFELPVTYISLVVHSGEGAPIHGAMATFLFRCPTTGFQVQGWSDDDLAAGGSHTTVTCLACGQLHVVNAKTAPAPGDSPERP